jgi:hypothetical protein
MTAMENQMQKGEVQLNSMALEHKLLGREFRCPLSERVLTHMLTDLHKFQIVLVKNGIISGQFNRGLLSKLKHLQLELKMLVTNICQAKCFI